MTGMDWVFAANYMEHKWEEDAMTETAVTDRLPDDLYKAAVDALYDARNSGLVMDQAAAAVARAVRPLIAAAALRDAQTELERNGSLAAAVFVGRMATEAAVFASLAADEPGPDAARSEPADVEPCAYCGFPGNGQPVGSGPLARLRADNERLEQENAELREQWQFQCSAGQDLFVLKCAAEAERDALWAAVDAAKAEVTRWVGLDCKLHSSWFVTQMDRALGATTTPEEPESFEPRVAEQMQRIRATTTQTSSEGKIELPDPWCAICGGPHDMGDCARIRAGATTEEPAEERHHVEATSRNGWMWGWHCLTCDIEASGYRSIADAEAAGDEHASAAAGHVVPEPKPQPGNWRSVSDAEGYGFTHSPPAGPVVALPEPEEQQ